MKEIFSTDSLVEETRKRQTDLGYEDLNSPKNQEKKIKLEIFKALAEPMNESIKNYQFESLIRSDNPMAFKELFNDYENGKYNREDFLRLLSFGDKEKLQRIGGRNFLKLKDEKEFKNTVKNQYEIPRELWLKLNEYINKGDISPKNLLEDLSDREKKTLTLIYGDDLFDLDKNEFDAVIKKETSSSDFKKLFTKYEQGRIKREEFLEKLPDDEKKYLELIGRRAFLNQTDEKTFKETIKNEYVDKLEQQLANDRICLKVNQEIIKKTLEEEKDVTVLTEALQDLKEYIVKTKDKRYSEFYRVDLHNKFAKILWGRLLLYGGNVEEPLNPAIEKKQPLVRFLTGGNREIFRENEDIFLTYTSYHYYEQSRLKKEAPDKAPRLSSGEEWNYSKWPPKLSPENIKNYYDEEWNNSSERLSAHYNLVDFAAGIFGKDQYFINLDRALNKILGKENSDWLPSTLKKAGWQITLSGAICLPDQNAQEVDREYNKMFKKLEEEKESKQ